MAKATLFSPPGEKKKTHANSSQMSFIMYRKFWELRLIETGQPAYSMLSFLRGADSKGEVGYVVHRMTSGREPPTN